MRALVFRAILIVAFVVSVLSFFAEAYLYTDWANANPEVLSTASANEYFVRLFWSGIGMAVSLLILLWQAISRRPETDVIVFEIGLVPIGKSFDDLKGIVGEPADFVDDE